MVFIARGRMCTIVMRCVEQTDIPHNSAIKIVKSIYQQAHVTLPRDPISHLNAQGFNGDCFRQQCIVEVAARFCCFD